MSEFVLHRNYTHRSTLGHIINFTKGEPTYVPPVCHREVALIGAIPVDGEAVSILGDEVADTPPLSAEERIEQLLAAFKTIENRSVRSDYTGQGLPAIPALRKLVNFDVEKREVEQLWREFKNGGEEE